jgi:hypothetical protein
MIPMSPIHRLHHRPSAGVGAVAAADQGAAEAEAGPGNLVSARRLLNKPRRRRLELAMTRMRSKRNPKMKRTRNPRTMEAPHQGHQGEEAVAEVLGEVEEEEEGGGGGVVRREDSRTRH